MAIGSTSGGVPSTRNSASVNMPPNSATASPSNSPSDSAVPAIALTLCGSCAPQAWPIRTEAPAPTPITSEMKKKTMGNMPATAASARVPSIWPTNTLLSVPESDCRMLARIIGPRKARNTRQSGRPGGNRGASGAAAVTVEESAIAARLHGPGGARGRRVVCATSGRGQLEGTGLAPPSYSPAQQPLLGWPPSQPMEGFRHAPDLDPHHWISRGAGGTRRDAGQQPDGFHPHHLAGDRRLAARHLCRAGHGLVHRRLR